MTLRRLVACGLGIGLAIVSIRARGQTPSTSSPFFDGFDGDAIDRSKWTPIVTGRTVNNEQQAYVDSPDNLFIVHGAEAEGADGGALVIQPRFHEGFAAPEGRRFDFTSGRLEGRGRASFIFGVFAARIKLPAGDGLWPAFWTLGEGRWPDTGEMDIMENVGAAAWFSVALHGPGYSGSTPFGKRQTFPNGLDVTAWHVYSMDWQPSSIAFGVDGTEFYRVTSEMVQPHQWVYGARDSTKFLILNMALGGNYPHGVNHVESPYPGLPSTTVDLIKEGKARMLVDWVRVEPK
jgi:beta-glucanase (GH16 family)